MIYVCRKYRPEGSKMKVKISLMVDIDPQAWTENYGVEGAEIRPDVQQYARTTILDQLESVGVLAR